MTARIVIAAEENFRPGLKTLLYSLARHNRELPPVTVASSTIREFPGCDVLRIDPREYAGCAAAGNRFEKAWYKIEAFRMAGPGPVVVLDADLLCLGSVAELFKPVDTIRACALRTGVSSGVLVLGPDIRSPENFKRLLHYGSARLSYDGGDQGAIDCLIRERKIPWLALPGKYNTLKRAYKTPTWPRIKDDIRLLHYVGSRKPWNAGIKPTGLEKNGGEDGFEELEALWKKYHTEAESWAG